MAAAEMTGDATANCMLLDSERLVTDRPATTLPLESTSEMLLRRMSTWPTPSSVLSRKTRR